MRLFSLSSFLFTFLIACGDADKDGIPTDEDCNDENEVLGFLVCLILVFPFDFTMLIVCGIKNSCCATEI